MWLISAVLAFLAHSPSIRLPRRLCGWSSPCPQLVSTSPQTSSLSQKDTNKRNYSLSHLVGFALKLRNLGTSDHGLIRELSAPLAGSLYTGEGHSRLYDDEAVYS